MISSRVKFLVNPNFPVTQNAHHIGHHTCDEIHNVILFSLALLSFTCCSFCR